MTTSTVDPNIPKPGTPVSSSAGIRSNFEAAYNDINALWAALAGIGGEVQQGSVYILSVVNATIPLVSSSEYEFTIETMDNLQVAAGAVTLSIAINGIPVTGMNGISVTTTPQQAVATANNVVGVGSRVTMVLSGNSGASGLEFTMKAAI